MKFEDVLKDVQATMTTMSSGSGTSLTLEMMEEAYKSVMEEVNKMANPYDDMMMVPLRCERQPGYHNYCPCPSCEERYNRRVGEENYYLRRENYMLKRELENFRYRSMDRNFEAQRWPGAPEKKMNLTTLAKRILDADTKALIKAGVLDNDLSLTEEGVDFVVGHYLQANKVELAKEARKITKEEKEDCEEK